VEEILGDRITRGVVVDVKVCPSSKRLATFCGTHPLPSDENMVAAQAIVDSLLGLTERDAALFVISGGGSTLLFLPEDKKNKEEVAIFNALTNAGAAIQEMNIVRRHLSLARGGHLARAAYPARVVSMIMSDVPGDDPSAIASGPTVKDATSIADAVAVLEKYNVPQVCSVENCGLIETPKDNKYFEHATNVIAVSSKRALEAMKTAAEKLGYRGVIRGMELTVEAREMGRAVVEQLHAAPSKTVLLWGGETTVTVHGMGQGGRNQEFAGGGLNFVREEEEVLSLASDGRDHGLFAGAICDTITRKVAEDIGLRVDFFLNNNNTQPFFERTGSYLVTGDTGSNVSDLIIALKT
jgi:glycerate-2-kinase